MELSLWAERSETERIPGWIKWLLCICVCNGVCVIVQVSVHNLLCLFEWTFIAHSSVWELSLHLQLTPLVGWDFCALLLARGDQLKPSSSVRGAELLSEPAELENRGFRLAPSSSVSSFLPVDRHYREILGICRLTAKWYRWCWWINVFWFLLWRLSYLVFISCEAHFSSTVCINMLYP